MILHPGLNVLDNSEKNHSLCKFSFHGVTKILIEITNIEKATPNHFYFPSRFDEMCYAITLQLQGVELSDS